MQFSQGQDIIVNVEGYNQTGKFVEEKDDKYLVDFFGVIEPVEKTKVQRYEPISFEAVEEWSNTASNDVVDIIKDAMESCFPGYPYQLKQEDNSVIMDGFSLEPAILRVNSIACVREFPGYELISWTRHYATREEPEDVTDKVVSEHRTALSAAGALMKIAIANYIDRWIESVQESQLSEEIFETF